MIAKHDNKLVIEYAAHVLKEKHVSHVVGHDFIQCSDTAALDAAIEKGEKEVSNGFIGFRTMTGPTSKIEVGDADAPYVHRAQAILDRMRIRYAVTSTALWFFSDSDAWMAERLLNHYHKHQ